MLLRHCWVLLTLSIWRDVHSMFDLHVSAKISLQVKFTRAVCTLEGFTSCMQVHVAQEVVHSVKWFSTHLWKTNQKSFTNLTEKVSHRDVWWIWSFTLHLKGFTGRCTIMWVLRVCFWTKDLKHTWHWNGRTLAWINMCLFKFADNVNSRAHTSHLNPFVPW